MTGFSPPRQWRSEFAGEWCAVLAAFVVDYAWALKIDFRLLLGWQDLILPAVLAAAYGAARGLASPRIGLLVEYLCLSVAGTSALVIFSYLCLASAQGPLMDPMLLSADRALGFDWLGLYRQLMQHPMLASVFRLIYQSLLLQGLYCTLLLALMQQRAVMKELWRLTFLASLLCCLGAMFFPALGPYKVFGLDAQGAFLPDMEHLLSHRNLAFAPGAMTGVVCFPSLHTAMALAYPYGLRRTGPIFVLSALLSLVMLFTIPFFGGHYLVDMIAGAGVMLVSLAIVRLLGSWRTAQTPLGEALPQA